MSYNTRTEDSKDHWETPMEFFTIMSREISGVCGRNIDLDVCATEINTKCFNHFTPEVDGLRQDWKGHVVWCNPPYKDIATWVRKCYFEGLKEDTIVVLLIPNRTDTRYFHDYCMKAHTLYLVKGRISFLLDGVKQSSPNFGSVVVLFMKKLRPYDPIKLKSFVWR